MSFFETVGKAIPNEFSKLSSIVKYIPYIGQAMSAVGGVDKFATGIADRRDQGANWAQAIIPSTIEGVQVGFGSSQDPGSQGSPGSRDRRDWANIAGQIGNLVSFTPSSGSGYMSSKNASPFVQKEIGQSANLLTKYLNSEPAKMGSTIDNIDMYNIDRKLF